MEENNLFEERPSLLRDRMEAEDLYLSDETTEAEDTTEAVETPENDG